MHVSNDSTDANGSARIKPTAPALRRTDRRPKGTEKMRHRSVSLSPKMNQIVANEALRRGYPSVSALIEHAITKEVAPRAEREEADLPGLLAEVRRIDARLHRLERETAERDVIAVELVAGLARAYFATAEVPPAAEQKERIAQARAQYERFLNAVGRKIESGDTTLNQLPDVHVAAVQEQDRQEPPTPGEG